MNRPLSRTTLKYCLHSLFILSSLSIIQQLIQVARFDFFDFFFFFFVKNKKGGGGLCMSSWSLVHLNPVDK